MNEEGLSQLPSELAPRRASAFGRRAGLLAAAIAVSGVVTLAALFAAGVFSGGGTDAPPAVEAQEFRYVADAGVVYDREPVTPIPTEAPKPSLAPVAPPPPPLGDSGYRMVIPSIGVDAPVGPYGLDVYQRPLVPLVGYEVAWYDFTSKPGTGGNAVFAGHVTWSGPAVFYSLSAIQPGAEIKLIGDGGTEIWYTVTESYMVNAQDPNAVNDVMGPKSTDMLTIITCDGEFYYTGDPVFRGDYTNRRVVRASLTSVNYVSGPPSSG